MKDQLVSILQDIKDGENIENYLLILAALVIAILSLVGIKNDAIITSIILAVLSLIIYGQIKTDRLLRSIKQASEIQGISAFYPDKQHVPPLESRISTSHEEVAIMGLQLSDIAIFYLPLLKQQAIKGCRIKLLMMSPVDDTGNALPWVDEVGKVHNFIGFRGMLISNIVHLTNWLEELPKDIRKRVEVRLYTTIPTASVILIDKDKESGSIKVEPIFHKFPPSERPSFVVDRSSSPALYRKLVDSFNDLWNMGLDVSNLKNFLDKSS
jgi:hypothetical protein